MKLPSKRIISDWNPRRCLARAAAFITVAFIAMSMSAHAQIAPTPRPVVPNPPVKVLTATLPAQPPVTVLVTTVGAPNPPVRVLTQTVPPFRTMTQTTLSSSQHNDDLLERRMQELRFPENEPVIPAVPDGKSVVDGKGSKEIRAAEPEKRWSFWGSGTGQFISVDGRRGGYDATNASGAVGVDYRVNRSLAIGVTGSYTGSDTDFGAGSVCADTGRGGIYGTWHEGGFYVDAAALGGGSSYDTHRWTAFGHANGSTSSSEFDALFKTGYDIKTGSLAFGPLASVRYTYLHLDGFSEKGPGGLDFNANQADSCLLRVGGHVTAQVRCGSMALFPEVQVAWQHEFLDDCNVIDGSTGFSDFRVRGPRIGDDSVFVSAGIRAQITPSVSANVFYDGDLARENYVAHSVTAGFTLGF